MKTMKSIRLLVGLIILLAVVTVFTSTAADKPTIHALLIIMDGDARYPGRYEIDYKRIQPLLRDVQDQGICDLKLKTLSSASEDDANRPTRDRVLEWINGLNPRPNDVVFVYFAGHGGQNGSEGDDGTFLTLVGAEKLYREELVNAMKGATAWSCRLKMLITDSCSGNGRGETKTNTSPHPDYNKTSAFRHLFVQHEGFLHIASASPGEVAFGDSQDGGWFTTGLVGTIYSHREAAKKFVGWNEVFTEVSNRVQESIGEMKASQKEDFERRHIRVQQNPKRYGEFPKPLRTESDLARWANRENNDSTPSQRDDTQHGTRIRKITLSLTEVTDEMPLQRLQIQVQFTVENSTANKVKVQAYFLHQDGKILKDLDSDSEKRYGTVNGQVVTEEQVKVNTNKATLSIPISQLHLPRGKNALEIVCVLRSLNGKELTRSTKSFELTNR